MFGGGLAGRLVIGIGAVAFQTGADFIFGPGSDAESMIGGKPGMCEEWHSHSAFGPTIAPER